MVWPSSEEGVKGKNPATGVEVETLKEIGLTSVTVPEEFVRFIFSFSELGERELIIVLFCRSWSYLSNRKSIHVFSATSNPVFKA